MKRKKSNFLYKFFSTHSADKSRVEMTCDKLINSKLENFANNNNNVTETAKPENYHQNGTISNGTTATTTKSPHKEKIVDEEELETRKSLMILAVIFVTALFAMFYIYKNFPRLDE